VGRVLGAPPTRRSAFQLLVFLLGAGLLVLADQPVRGAGPAVVATTVVVLDRVLAAAQSR
jgi:hypothetical protein